MSEQDLTDTSDSGPEDDSDENDSGPIRRCLASGERHPRETLIRFVVSPDGIIVPDIAAALPGRGLWLKPDRKLLETAIAKRGFDRAAKRKVSVPTDLASTVEALLARRCVDGLGLARRAGKAVAGFEKVSAMLKSGQAGLILAASDGAEDGRRKIAGLAPGLPIIDCLTSAELASAFGRDHVVHAAILAGTLANRLIRDAARLEGLRA
jgi:predicted RNA-binding protein YlxR (DUF448 family)/ribosomal protein L30E